MSASKEELRKVEKLIKVISDIYPSTKELIWKSFVKGVFMGLGTTLGASIIIALLAFIISRLKTVPVVRHIIIETNVEEILP